MPLNDLLYKLLQRRFGTVKISREGEAMRAKYVKTWQGDWQLDVQVAGEYYMVNCPFCRDTKYRLFLNHRWGVRDEEGHVNLWLAICYNENCLKTHDRRVQLLEELNLTSADLLARAKIHKGKEVNVDDIKMSWPGPVTRIDRLPKTHHAVQYLKRRHFDVKRLGQFYDVHYCEESFNWLCRDRIIIPIYSRGVLKGFQARFIGERSSWSDGPPKYYTAPGTPRRFLLYNHDNAVKFQTGVVMEGPSDVWSFGPMGMCTMGSTMTDQQIRLLTRGFRRHSAILLWDPDVWERPKERERAEALVRKLEGRFDKGFASVLLPTGKDPGKLDRQFLREYVGDHAASQGVKVSWRLR